MHKFILLPLLFCVALFSSGCNTNSGNTGRNIGVATGAILGAIIGAQLGDGSDLNIAAGAAAGAALRRTPPLKLQGQSSYTNIHRRCKESRKHDWIKPNFRPVHRIVELTIKIQLTVDARERVTYFFSA